ncbi:hypothetical protein NPIL_420231 [Nephila pilipes]|uniref:Uncharacterized protein n=1 Tax=Nephila pilipes TaxID=299642 RepID=A0A8X6ISU2_NEPPI|nr:hypothetical protein NPIL_420231 [Nephila pilipes]
MDASSGMSDLSLSYDISSGSDIIPGSSVISEPGIISEPGVLSRSDVMSGSEASSFILPPASSPVPISRVINVPSDSLYSIVERWRPQEFMTERDLHSPIGYRRFLPDASSTPLYTDIPEAYEDFSRSFSPVHSPVSPLSPTLLRIIETPLTPRTLFQKTRTRLSDRYAPDVSIISEEDSYLSDDSSWAEQSIVTSPTFARATPSPTPTLFNVTAPVEGRTPAYVEMSRQAASMFGTPPPSGRRIHPRSLRNYELIEMSPFDTNTGSAVSPIQIIASPGANYLTKLYGRRWW